MKLSFSGSRPLCLVPCLAQQVSTVSQVMSPMHRTAAGVVALNAFLQGLLNPASPDKAELALTRSHGSTADYNSSPVALRERDRVIQCSNNYQKDVFNGDIGFVTKVKSATRELWVQYQGECLTGSGMQRMPFTSVQSPPLLWCHDNRVHCHISEATPFMCRV